MLTFYGIRKGTGSGAFFCVEKGRLSFQKTNGITYLCSRKKMPFNLFF